MNEYLIEYTCADGYSDEAIVSAANSTMAIEMIKDFDIDDIVSVSCHRIVEAPQCE